MIIATSLLHELLDAQPHLRSQMYFKSSLTALSHAMEDQVLAGEDEPIVIACFQRERFYRQEASRYLRIAERSPQVYVLAAPETDFKNCSDAYETVAFAPEDGLSQEWHLVVLGKSYSLCLICREHPQENHDQPPPMVQTDQARRFEGIWTFDRAVSCKAAELLLQRILQYRPELKSKVKQALEAIDLEVVTGFNAVDTAPFADRLVTYLQAGQYKQNKAYRQIAAKERKERLVNSISTAIRQSLDPHHVLSVAVEELGHTLQSDRCIIYQCSAQDESALIEYEFKGAAALPSLIHQTWNYADNPWFEELSQVQDCIFIDHIRENEKVLASPGFLRQLIRASIHSLLMVPIIYQKQLIGLIELHQCQSEARQRYEDNITVIEAIAAQVGVALIQAQAYADLESLNEQLADLERTRSNLIAITGHELRTPLSTIQVCLESLATEPDMPEELRDTMLSTALTDAERMRKLVQDFLTLSRLESGRVDWHSEAISLFECVNLALSSVSTRYPPETVPEINLEVAEDLPFIQADGEWLVEVLVKLIDNACKFSSAEDQLTLKAQVLEDRLIQVSVIDTGRGIEPDRLEAVFERFYQEEGALRRTTGGTGLGLAICRQIIRNMGGKIWAQSAGKNQGSTFSFTVPLASPR
ncbi:DICT sensory domain-containing protein [Lyngbya confervoides]|uniref:histidine kinase n=1 Tax=Lyngbya confervoides BDU141951 TaxID=1574623 RepID=A0ABD4T8W0_9CYAN|nr:DICT sensory domain-containing protein [Lyngbya confervoides]MCM1985046.1 ATP-binding protein [Lyngbya confervoides BDU141951]